MTLKLHLRRAAALSMLLAACAGLALAHEGATGVVKERMDLMKGQAKQMKLIGDMAKGKKTGGGSRKGKPNRLTTTVKGAIEYAANEVGGAERLAEWI